MKWIFLPGMDGSGAFFEPFLQVLPPSISVQTIAFPATEKMGYEELRSWLRDRWPRQEPFVIIAESFSGPLAVQIAAEAPASLQAVVVSASFVKNPLPRGLRHLPAERVLGMRFPRPVVNFLLANSDGSGADFYDLFCRVMRYSPPDVLAHRARAALQVDKTDALKACRLPLLFLEGMRDRLISRSAMRHVRKVRPDLPIIPFEAPHFLLQTKPRESYEVIQDFLKSAGG